MPDIEKAKRRLLAQLVGASAAVAAAPVLALTSSRVTLATTGATFVSLGGYLLMPVSFVLLALFVWPAVQDGELGRMEAWWWLSTPYTLIGPALDMFRPGQNLDPMLRLPYAVMALSSAVWVLTAAGQFIVQERQFAAARKRMLLVALLMWLADFHFLYPW